jgi:S1-C subfamily serine protease
MAGAQIDASATISGASAIGSGAVIGAGAIVVGSIITSIDGVKIANRDAAIVKIRSYAPGSVITVVVRLPNGTSNSYKVTLGSAAAL